MLSIISKIQRINKGPLPNNTLISIYREIMSASLSLNKELKISYLGPRGTYSHQVNKNIIIYRVFK